MSDKSLKFPRQAKALSSSELPIGVFDSGVGGLTVLRELRKALPFENLSYLGDTARLPYGNKSPESIIRFSLENADYLVRGGIKALVVACNTATACALESLEQALHVPVIGVIAPGVAAATANTRTGHIAVLGTRGTIRSGAYQRAIAAQHSSATVHALACPLFVPLVEENLFQHQVTRLIVQDYLRPLRDTSVDTLILGCTHYPLLRTLIQEEIGNHVTIIDAAAACASAVGEILTQTSLLNRSGTAPQYHYFVSDDPESFSALGSMILGDTVAPVGLLP